MRYFTNCSECGKPLDEPHLLVFQEIQKDKKLGKWWRANKCVPCNTKYTAEMIRLEQQLSQFMGWDCLNWQKFPDGLL